MTIRDRAFSAVRWTAVANIGRAGAAMLQLVILARLLQPADFGLMALALTVISLAVLISDMGMSNALIFYRDVNEDELSSLYWLNVALGAGLSALIAICSPLIARFYEEARLTNVLLSASGVLLIASIGQQIRVRAEKDLRFSTVARIEVAAALLGVVVATVMAATDRGVYSIVGGLMASTTATTVLLWVFLSDGWRPRLHFRLADVRRFLNYGAHAVAINIANSLTLQSDMVIAGTGFQSTQLGFFSQPRDLCLRIMFVINPIITRVGLPLIATVQQDRARVRALYLKTLRMTASVNFPIYGAISLFAPEIVGVLLGDRWAPAEPLLRILAIWCAFRSIGNPVGSLLFATGETRRAFVSSTTVLVLLVVSVVIGMRFGLAGIATSLTILYAGLVVPFWLFLIRPTCGAGFVEYHLQLAIPFLCTAFAVVAGWAAAFAFSSDLARGIAGSAGGAIAYLAASYALNREWYDAMRELLTLSARSRASKA